VPAHPRRGFRDGGEPKAARLDTPAVNRLVAGSNPARGAKQINDLVEHLRTNRALSFITGNRAGNILQISQTKTGQNYF
jgi:hypothetical protein